MLRKYKVANLIVGIAVASGVAAIATPWLDGVVRSAKAEPVPGPYVYAAKFVCGYQQPLSHSAGFSESVVKPGNYASDINIHNPQQKGQELQKKLILMVEEGKPIAVEPHATDAKAIHGMALKQDQA